MSIKQPKTISKRLDELTDAPYNPRKISDESLAALGHSLDRFGLVEPIIWNKRTGHVVGGHQRLRAMRERGETATQVVAVDLPEIEEKALNVALNSPTLTGEFTNDLDTLLEELREELPELCDELNFDDLEIPLTKITGNTETSDITEWGDEKERPSIRVSMSFPPQVWIEARDAIIADLDRVCKRWGSEYKATE